MMASHDDLFADIRRQLAGNDAPAQFDTLPLDSQQKVLKEIYVLNRKASGDAQVPSKMMWHATIEAALAHSTRFQEIVADAFINGMSVKPETMSLNQDWVCGIYLEGIYSKYTTFEGAYKEAIHEHTTEIITKASNLLISMLENVLEELRLET
jgi:hypothetical protein